MLPANLRISTGFGRRIAEHSNRVSRAQSKHIDIQFRNSRELQATGMVQFSHVFHTRDEVSVSGKTQIFRRRHRLAHIVMFFFSRFIFHGFFFTVYCSRFIVYSRLSLSCLRFILFLLHGVGALFLSSFLRWVYCVGV